MPAKGLLLRSLVKLLELVLPQPAPATSSAAGEPAPESPVDAPMELAVRVVQRWADVNRVPLPRVFILYSAERCPSSRQVRSEIHWAIKTLFTRVRDDHGEFLGEAHGFKLELAIATASRAWRLIEERDEDDEIDATHVVSAYASFFDPEPVSG